MIVFEKSSFSILDKMFIAGKVVFKFREDLKKKLQEEPQISSIDFEEKYYRLRNISYIKEDSEEVIYVLNYDEN